MKTRKLPSILLFDRILMKHYDKVYYGIYNRTGLYEKLVYFI